MSQQMAGLISGPGKEFTIYFNPEQLEAKRKKYGQYFIPLGQVAMQAAAPSRKKPTLSKNDFASDTLKKVKQSKPVKPVKVEKPAKVEKPKREYLNHYAHNVKAVICVTNGLYYPTMQLAAQAVGTAANNIGRLIRANLLKRPGQKRRKTAGHEFRLATEKEIQAKKMLRK